MPRIFTFAKLFGTAGFFFYKQEINLLVSLNFCLFFIITFAGASSKKASSEYVRLKKLVGDASVA